MLRVHAISAGEHAPRRRFDGTVHSVFEKACNVRLDDGRLLCLLLPQLANLPHGIRIQAPQLDFSHHLRAGQRVGCRADVLRLGDAGLAIDLASARLWRSELPGPDLDLDRPEAALAWRTAWCALARHERDDPGADDAGRSGRRLPAVSPSDPLRRAVVREALRLARAARRFRADRAGAAIRGLTGLGPGLTPAGDDVIVGFLAGLWSAHGDRAERLAFLRSLGETVLAAAAATNEISGAFLRHATVGSVAEPLAGLARRIGEAASPDEVEFATRRALSVGHTSGADAVVGLLLGLAAWRFSGQTTRIQAQGQGASAAACP
jgi:hypothetical protein